MTGQLDAIIATLAVILGVSLVVQGVQQIMKQWLDLKSMYMRIQLLSVFDPLMEPIKIRFLGLRRVNDLARSANPFAETVVNGIERVMGSFGYADLDLLENIDAKKLKDLLTSVEWSRIDKGDEVKKNLKQVQKEVDRWFEIAKSGFQQLYARKMRVWSFYTSFVLVLAMNANLFTVYHQFAVNEPLRSAAIQWSENIAEENIRRDTSTATLTDSARVALIRAEVCKMNEVLSSPGFQVLGWNQQVVGQLFGSFNLAMWLSTLGGWLAMTMLVSFGAPFWYDLLKMVMGLKGTIRSTQDKKGERSTRGTD